MFCYCCIREYFFNLKKIYYSFRYYHLWLFFNFFSFFLYILLVNLPFNWPNFHHLIWIQGARLNMAETLYFETWAKLKINRNFLKALFWVLLEMQMNFFLKKSSWLKISIRGFSKCIASSRIRGRLSCGLLCRQPNDDSNILNLICISKESWNKFFVFDPVFLIIFKELFGIKRGTKITTN